jgi:outer membrane receptor protein involved in Fe transport
MDNAGRQLQQNLPARQAGRRFRPLCTVSVIALAMACAGAASAQEAVEEIVVTGSRLATTGFTAPTPTTVIGTADLQRVAPNNVSDVLNALPSFRASISPKNSSLTQSGAGSVFLDLRGLGAQRTLVLVNGRRHVASNNSNNVNIAQFPSLLIDRVDVVTGGASAAYGSDAVAGVVNIITKTRMQGFQATAQYGATDLDDGINYLVGAAGGTSFNSGRGHITIGAEYTKDDGLDYRDRLKREYWIQGRDRLTNAAWRTNGQPGLIFSRNVQFANQYPGGVITGGAPASSGLIGTTFGNNGTTGKLNFGQIYGTNMIGGGQPGNYFMAMQDIQAATNRWAVSGFFDYQLTDTITFSAEASTSLFHAHSGTVSFRDAGNTAATVPATTTSLVARIDNPFLPASVRAQMQAAGVNAVFVGRDAHDIDFSITDPRVIGNTTQRTTRFVAGLDGELGVGNFKWDGYYQYGRVDQDERRPGNRVPTRYRLATDVVTNPANGQPICRSTLTDPGNGCVPFNFFGPNMASQAARDYITQTAILNAEFTQQVLAGNLRGDLFNNWAGPVSLAVGAEWRQEKAAQVVDAFSAASLFEFTNSQPYQGKVTVKEVYGELGVPLLKDVTGFKALDLNLAGRVTDYSSSGTVATWKVGLSWEVFDDLRLRGTVSRDIRAANIGELYSKASGGAFFVPVDRVLNTVAVGAIPTVVSSNPNLNPERGTTVTFGAVYQPSWLRGFRASVDFFDIDIKDQIARIDGQTTIDRCAAGLTEVCSLIVRDPVSRAITSVNSAFLNLNRFKTNGQDFEVSFSRPFSDFTTLIPGDFTLRVLATHTAHLTQYDSQGALERAGQLAGTLSINSVPHWLGNGSFTYRLNALTLGVQGRFIGAANIDNTYKPGTSTSSNLYRIGANSYWNLSASYDIVRGDRTKVQLFGVIDDVFNKHVPFPFMPSALVSSPYYTTLERSYRFGIRFSH